MRRNLLLSPFSLRDGKLFLPYPRTTLYSLLLALPHYYFYTHSLLPPQFKLESLNTLLFPTPRHKHSPHPLRLTAMSTSTTTSRTSLFVSVLALLAVAPSSVFAIGDFPCAGSTDSQSCLAWSTDGAAQGEISANAVCQPGMLLPSFFHVDPNIYSHLLLFSKKPSVRIFR